MSTSESIIAHLIELRTRLLRIAAVVVVITAGPYAYINAFVYV